MFKKLGRQATTHRYGIHQVLFLQKVEQSIFARSKEEAQIPNMLEAQYLLFVNIALGRMRKYLRVDLQEVCAKLHVAAEEGAEYVCF